MNRIYLVFTCDKCDEDVHYGPVGSLHPEHRGLPVFSGEMVEQIRVTCGNCGSTMYFGDLDFDIEIPE